MYERGKLSAILRRIAAFGLGLAVALCAGCAPAPSEDEDGPAASLSVSPRISLPVGGQAEIAVLSSFPAAAIAWSSDDEDVATVEGGLVTAVGVGEATVTASAGELLAFCSVTVTDPAGLDPEPGQDPGPVATVTDEALRGKLWAMYTLEEDFTLTGYVCEAVDPFTGEAIAASGSYRVGAAAAAVARGRSRRAYRTGSAALSLRPLAEGAAAADGISVSFWAYNADTLVGATETGMLAGYSNLFGGGRLRIGWGYLYLGGDPLQPGDAVLGRGAYTARSYAAASAVLTAEELASARNNPYFVPNAVGGGLTEEAAGEYERAMAEELADRWRYVTVTISEAGVCFYADGALAYSYGAELLDLYAGLAGSSWGELYAEAFAALQAGEASLFGEPTGIFADDVLFGSALTADEAALLYADVSREAVG